MTSVTDSAATIAYLHEEVVIADDGCADHRARDPHHTVRADTSFILQWLIRSSWPEIEQVVGQKEIKRSFSIDNCRARSYIFMKKSTMLSTTSEYALRALTQLAAAPEGSSILGRDLAEQAGIPANYLSKILWTLGNAGIIDATRGNRGGYRLKRPADEIRLYEVVELFERDRMGHACVLGHRDGCDVGNPCSAHESWREVRTAYFDFLHTKTVADITRMELPNAGG
ncbi:MAG: Rrf2 family transcriptional regulator [Bryobacteraceae bacterium]